MMAAVFETAFVSTSSADGGAQLCLDAFVESPKKE